jgi:hypothetical protein
MEAIFEIWDTETANLIGTYATEQAALEVVREAIATWGRLRAEALALGVTNGDGNLRGIASGAELIARATMAMSDRG